MVSWSLWIADVLSHCTPIYLQYVRSAEKEKGIEFGEEIGNIEIYMYGY
jgi:hypothetical protein